jgi:hypothetical protein
MKEAVDVLSFFATQAGAFRFFALLFPGFVAVAIYDLRVPGERRKFADMGIALVAYSIVIDGLSAIYLSLWPIPADDKARAIIVGFVADIIVPVLIGWVVVDIREGLAGKGLVLSAMPKAWDAFFSRISKVEKGQSIALVLTLKDVGKLVVFGLRARSHRPTHPTRTF